MSSALQTYETKTLPLGTQAAELAGQLVKLQIDVARRAAIRANHSATHLLHEALRQRLGTHVAQKGSLVAPERLRFDVSHPVAMTPAELADAEAAVNAQIRGNGTVTTRLMTPDEAKIAVTDYIAYFGTYTVDEKAGTVTHHRQASIQPGDGGNLVRAHDAQRHPQQPPPFVLVQRAKGETLSPCTGQQGGVMVEGGRGTGQDGRQESAPSLGPQRGSIRPPSMLSHAG